MVDGQNLTPSPNFYVGGAEEEGEGHCCIFVKNCLVSELTGPLAKFQEMGTKYSTFKYFKNALQKDRSHLLNDHDQHKNQ